MPRPAGKFRAALFGGIAALAFISALFAVRLLDYRFTNVPQFAQKISAAAGKNDVVIVTPWQLGITFNRYFHGACEWTTVPPLAEHTAHRFDLIQLQMANSDVMTPVLEKNFRHAPRGRRGLGRGRHQRSERHERARAVAAAAAAGQRLE